MPKDCLPLIKLLCAIDLKYKQLGAIPYTCLNKNKEEVSFTHMAALYSLSPFTHGDNVPRLKELLIEYCNLRLNRNTSITLSQGEPF